MRDKEQILESLGRDLDPSLVKHRRQGGQSLSYIESHTAIQTANQIFGYGGWSSTTDELREYSNPSGVLFWAKVTVQASIGDDWIQFSGIGTCIAAKPRDAECPSMMAVETAIKGAESDAQKRALRHLGRRFGLGLYGAPIPDERDAERIARENALEGLLAARGIRDIGRAIEKRFGTSLALLEDADLVAAIESLTQAQEDTEAAAAESVKHGAGGEEWR